MKKRIRKCLTWQATWTPKIEAWTAAQINLNLWRFDRTEGFDDIMQEARILFWQLGKYYPVVNQENHFFTLYKTSLLRKFHDKARIKQKSVIDQDSSVDELAELALGSVTNNGLVSLLVEEMPDELKIVLQALTTGRVRRTLDKPTKKLLPRENHNMRLKRKFSLTDSDPVGALRSYFLNT